MKKSNKNNGITLISLVITIIVMLILVGVSITLAVNGGLFEYAGNAVSDTNSEKNKEYEQLNGKIKIDGEWYESIDEYLNFSERAELPEGIKVGDYVNYTPTKGTYSLSKDISGYTDDQAFETETKENNNELEWRILSINRRSGEIELVSATAAQTEQWVYLDEANGYNFGVDILNDLCKSLYSNTAGAEARSMNIDDINKKTTYNAEKDASNYNEKYKSTIFKDFPSLYTIEKGSEIEGVTKGTLTENEGVRNADGTANYTKYKGIQTSASWYVTHTYYNYDIESYLDNDLGMNTAPKDLFVIDHDYLLASRCVGYFRNGEGIGFGLREASSEGRVYSYTCYSSNERYEYKPSGSASSYSKIGIRPVINLGTNFKITKAATPDGKNGTYWDIEFTKDNNLGTLEKQEKMGMQ